MHFVSIVVTAAALFGWLSVRVCRLAITIGTMLLTVISSVMMIVLGRVFPGLQAWAVSLVGRIRFEDLILHGMLGLLLFAGAFLLDLFYLSKEKLAVRAPFGHRHTTLDGCSGLCHALDAAALWDRCSVDRVPFLRRTDLSHRSRRRARNAASGVSDRYALAVSTG